ncbi:MAG: nucleoside deaminase [Oscillospiraceae bacterium]|nr:nucleoside deaminase [Oscillospiraceae bacterium]
MQTHEHYMKIAMKLAEEAAKDGETPVGAVIIDQNGQVLGTGRNRREKENSATAHAEIEAIEEVGKQLKDWRLSGFTIYVTLEPCPMCAGAIIMSRMNSLYYGAKDELTGSCGSVINLFMEPYGTKTKVTGGILEKECSALLKAFFKNLR